MQISQPGTPGKKPVSQWGSEQLPPSWRDFQVYRLVKIEQRSTRGAATAMQLSQTRVCQIVSRVAEFLLANMPGADDEEQHRRQLRLAEQLAAERIEFLQRQAVQGFDKSQEPIEFQGKQLASSGDPRFLYLAARLALMAAKLPAPRLNDAVFNPELNAEQLAEWERAEVEADSVNPPAEGCSPISQRSPDQQRPGSSASEAKPLPPESSIGCVSVDLLAKLEQTKPVQPARSTHATSIRTSAQKRRAAFLAGP